MKTISFHPNHIKFSDHHFGSIWLACCQYKSGVLPWSSNHAGSPLFGTLQIRLFPIQITMLNEKLCTLKCKVLCESTSIYTYENCVLVGTCTVERSSVSMACKTDYAITDLKILHEYGWIHFFIIKKKCSKISGCSLDCMCMNKSYSKIIFISTSFFTILTLSWGSQFTYVAV